MGSNKKTKKGFIMKKLLYLMALVASMVIFAGCGNNNANDEEAQLAIACELTSEEYGIGFRLTDTELKDKVNGAIAELVEDGTLPALAEKYGLNLAF